MRAASYENMQQAAHEDALETGGTTGGPDWATAQQVGDRVEGKKVAKLVNSKRTPTGGFFNTS